MGVLYVVYVYKQYSKIILYNKLILKLIIDDLY